MVYSLAADSKKPGHWAPALRPPRYVRRQVDRWLRGLVEGAGEAFLHRRDGLGRDLLRVIGKLLGLRGDGVELRAHIAGVELDYLGIGLRGQQFAEQVVSGVAVGAGGFDQL